MMKNSPFKFYRLSFLALMLVATGCQHNNCDPCTERTYIHKYGVEVEEDYWNTSGQCGKVITSFRNGVCESQTFSNGKLHGDAYCTYPNSQQVAKNEVWEDDRCVKRTDYAPCGAPLASLECPTDEIRTLTEWYEGGSPRCIENYERDLLVNAEYYDLRHQKESWVHNGEGERFNRDRFGQFISLDEIKNGQMLTRTTYHTNGSISEITPYNGDGKIEGLKKSYNPDGTPLSIESWQYGKQQGVTTHFQRGEKFAEVPYLDNKKNGIERRYSDGTNVSQEITWSDNKMHGPSFTYADNSMQTDWYWKGKLTTQSNFESYLTPKYTAPVKGN